MSKVKHTRIFKLNTKEEQAERNKIQQALLEHQKANIPDEPNGSNEFDISNNIKLDELDTDATLDPDEISFFLDIYTTIPVATNPKL